MGKIRFLGVRFGRRAAAVAAAAWLMIFTSGCLYPDSMRSGQQVPVRETVAAVQSAVDQYISATSVLPIKNFTMDTPLYERYVVDFAKLSPYLGEIPPNAFEKGGTHLYVLVNAENNPQVRLLDLVTAQTVNDLALAVREYSRQHGGSLPLGEEAAAGWHAVDFELLGQPPVQVRSVFSGMYLNVLMNRKGEIIVDYGPDLAVLIREQSLTPEPETDLRALLVEHSLYVPVKSAAYYWRNNEPSIAAG